MNELQQQIGSFCKTNFQASLKWLFPLMRLTFYYFLWVIEEEFAERGPFGPFESVQQLLDLGGHPAADRHAWINTKTQSRPQTNNRDRNTDAVLPQRISLPHLTHSHTGRTLRSSTVGIRISSRKDSKGKFWTRGHTQVRLFLGETTYKKRSTSTPRTLDKQKKVLESKLIGLRQRPSPSPGSLYITFSFSFF